jgi:hypothetical protein
VAGGWGRGGRTKDESGSMMYENNTNNIVYDYFYTGR